MALLRISHRVWWSHVPFVGGYAPAHHEDRGIELDPTLRMKVAQRPKGLWDFLMGLNFVNWATGWLRGSWKTPKNDHLVIDTGKRLVDITGDRLDLSGVKVGDDVEFQLDSVVDPGGATFVKGRVIVVADAPDPGVGGSGARPANPSPPPDLDRPIDSADPVGDLIVRRAELFQAFKNGELTQEELRNRWDALRDASLKAVSGGNLSFFERKDQMQQLIETGSFTMAELDSRGIDLAEFELAGRDATMVS